MGVEDYLTEEAVSSLTDYLAEEWLSRRQTVLGRLAATDDKMKRSYTKAIRDEPESYVFTSGDLVWVK